MNSRAGIVNLPTNRCAYNNEHMTVHGFPWGFPIGPIGAVDVSDKRLHVAVVHEYVWKEGHCFPGVTLDKHVSEFVKRTEGYDAVLVGDNHRSFLHEKIYNHGVFIPRNADERDVVPQVGVLWSDGQIEIVELDRSGDRWNAGVVAAETETPGTFALMELLRELKDFEGGFRDAIRDHLERINAPAALRAIVNDWIPVPKSVTS